MAAPKAPISGRAMAPVGASEEPPFSPANPPATLSGE